MHPDDVPFIKLLREDLADVFLAVARRYRLAGLGDDDARHKASDFLLALFKQATLDIPPDVDKLTLGERLLIVRRLRISVLLSLAGLLASSHGLAIWLGRLVR